MDSSFQQAIARDNHYAAAIAEAEASLETSMGAINTYRSHNCGELTEQT